MEKTVWYDQFKNIVFIELPLITNAETLRPVMEETVRLINNTEFVGVLIDSRQIKDLPETSTKLVFMEYVHSKMRPMHKKDRAALVVTGNFKKIFLEALFFAIGRAKLTKFFSQTEPAEAWLLSEAKK